MISTNRQLAFLIALPLASWLVFQAAAVQAQHQTSTTSPVGLKPNLGYTIKLRQVDFGILKLPTLHSFAVGTYQGKWVMLAGRTNGLHGFTGTGQTNFPVATQNHEIWVVDPATGSSWRRSLLSDSSGLSADDVAALTTTNNQFMQRGNRLYTVGGYAANATSGFSTHNALASIDLPGIINWVITGNGIASNHIRLIRNELFRVTGGAMYDISGRTHLVLGQNFSGGYTTGRNGLYTSQVRSFDIVDNGTTLSINNVTQTTPVPEYRRRDLNVFPTLKLNLDGTLSRGLTALSGVFTEADGVWTVPLEIDANGNPTMANASSAGTFKQGMNNYHCAKLGMFSESTGEMHEILFGGMTLVDYNPATQQFYQDDNVPWTNSLTAVVRSPLGQYNQTLIGTFPKLLDSHGNLLRFGANAEFIPLEGLKLYDNGVIQLDSITESTVLGHIYGGLFANVPHVRGVPGAISGASNIIWEVTLVRTPSGTLVVPEGVKLKNGVASTPQARMNASDNQYFELAPNLKSRTQTVELLLQSHLSTSEPFDFAFWLEASMSEAKYGDVIQLIQLFNYDTGKYETIDERPAATSDQQLKFTPAGDWRRFVQVETHLVQARIEWRINGAVPRLESPWFIDVDQAVWWHIGK